METSTGREFILNSALLGPRTIGQESAFEKLFSQIHRARRAWIVHRRPATALYSSSAMRGPDPGGTQVNVSSPPGELASARSSESVRGGSPERLRTNVRSEIE